MLLVDTKLGVGAGEDLTDGSGAAGEGLGSKASPVIITNEATSYKNIYILPDVGILLLLISASLAIADATMCCFSLDRLILIVIEE